MEIKEQSGLRAVLQDVKLPDMYLIRQHFERDGIDDVAAYLREKLARVDVNSLSMGQESLAESIRPKQWYNPFPKVRYTERPDTAAACVMEGNIILMVDNSAAVMILPTTFFDFTQEANDFYFPPLVGTYLRVLRSI